MLIKEKQQPAFFTITCCAYVLTPAAIKQHCCAAS